MVVRTSDDTVVKEIAPIGESGVFPFTGPGIVRVLKKIPASAW